ncbi:MAG: GTP cyclohydrolase I [Sphaerochaeta sp.]|jgi:GTP cyclohydrolase I
MQTEQDKIKQVYKTLTRDQIEHITQDLNSMKSFGAHENVELSLEQRAVMTYMAAEKTKELFDILKLDYSNDVNLKDTPFRFASMQINELMVGRFTKAPRIESFDELIQSNVHNLEDLEYNDYETIVTKKIDLHSMCSHHLMPFSTEGQGSYALISYIPNGKFLGISKLQRIADWYSRRPQLQENLTRQIFNHVCATIDSPNVMVAMSNLIHTCETQRGVESNCGATSTIQFGGIFKDSKLRSEILLQHK